MLSFVALDIQVSLILQFFYCKNVRNGFLIVTLGDIQMPYCEKHFQWYKLRCEACTRPHRYRLDYWPNLKKLKRIEKAMVVFHGGTTPPSKLKVSKGFRGAGLGKLGNPAILSGGGTTDTVTTSKDPEVSATYLSRGGGRKYLYALLLPANEAIDLGAALELSEYA